MFTVKTNREKVYSYDKDGNAFKLKFTFLVKEDRDMKALQDKFTSAKKDADGKMQDEAALNILLYTMRTSMTGWEGIVDEEGKEVPFSEDAQKGIFDAVTDLEGVLTDLIMLYTGPTGKNSSTGVTQ